MGIKTRINCVTCSCWFIFPVCLMKYSPAKSQERAGVKMILIQDGSQPPNIDKPLRIIGDPYKVQVLKHSEAIFGFARDVLSYLF